MSRMPDIIVDEKYQNKFIKGIKNAEESILRELDLNPQLINLPVTDTGMSLLSIACTETEEEYIFKIIV